MKADILKKSNNGADGTVIRWSELKGSQKGTVDIVQVLTDAGFEVNEV